jgi:hypothetical protein
LRVDYSAGGTSPANIRIDGHRLHQFQLILRRVNRRSGSSA